MSKIRNTETTDKRGFRHTCYVVTATQNLKDFHNYGHVHIIWTYQNAIFNFLILDDLGPDCVSL